MSKQIYECCGCGYHSEEQYNYVTFQDITGKLYNLFTCDDCKETLTEIQKESLVQLVNMLQEMVKTARLRHPNL